MKTKNIKFSTISPPPPRAAPGDAQIGRGAAGEQNRQKSIEKINFEEYFETAIQNREIQEGPEAPGRHSKTYKLISVKVYENHCKNNGLRTAYANNIEKTMFSGVIEAWSWKTPLFFQ